jgi:preprotein translocase SecE subunit
MAKKQESGAKEKKSAKNKNRKESVGEFISNTMDELKKIHTPSRQETIQGTIGVVLMVFFFGLFLGLSDFLVGKVMQAIFT